MVEDNQSVFWDEIVSSQNNLHSVEGLKQSLKSNSRIEHWYSKSMGWTLDTDHIESLPGGVEGVRDSPIERPTEGEDEETGSVEEIEAQEDGAVP